MTSLQSVPQPARQILAAKMAVQAVLSTLAATRADGPAPEGTIYAGLTAQGCTLSQFQGLMGSMERTQMVSREGHLVTITDKGCEASSRLAAEIVEIKRKYSVQ